MVEWPHWWHWELEISQHLLKRMIDRGFNEVDVREMLEDAADFRPNHEPSRFAIRSHLDGHPFELILEPLMMEEILLVVTAYPLD
jgi:hypothetical protein